MLPYDSLLLLASEAWVGPSGPRIQHWKRKEVHKIRENIKNALRGKLFLMRLFGAQLQRTIQRSLPLWWRYP